MAAAGCLMAVDNNSAVTLEKERDEQAQRFATLEKKQTDRQDERLAARAQRPGAGGPAEEARSGATQAAPASGAPSPSPANDHAQP